MPGSILLGTQGWSYRSWVGNFYPAGTPAGQYLIEYSKRFRTVEIDSTFYGLPSPKTVNAWYELTPNDFRFTAKFPRSITQEKMLRGVKRETTSFLKTMQLLEDKLGPLLLQFPIGFTPERYGTLARYLAALPQDFRYAVEVRHPGWLNDKFYDLLARHRAAMVLTTSPEAAHLEPATADFSYIRWLGSRMDVPDNAYQQVRINRDAQLDAWSNLIKKLSAQGTTVWGFANNHYQGHSPATVRALLERLGVMEHVPIRVTSPAALKSEIERRTSPRLSATYRIAYECFNRRGIKVDEGPARTVDISGRGALVEIPRGVDLDASMVLLVMAPFHMVMVKGNVVHSRPTGKGSFHVGVRLTEVIEGTWDLLEQVVREQIGKMEWPASRLPDERR